MKGIASGILLSTPFEKLFLETIWEAYNLKGCKIYFLKFIYFIQLFCMFFMKYLLHLESLYTKIENFLDEIFRAADGAMIIIVVFVNFIFRPLFGFLMMLLFTLPFQLFSIPFELTTKNCYSFVYLPRIFEFIYTLIFPLFGFIIPRRLIHDFDFHTFFGNTTRKTILNTIAYFQIQDEENKMWAIPLLIQKIILSKLWYFIFMSTFLKFLVEILFTLPFFIVIVLCQNYEDIMGEFV